MIFNSIEAFRASGFAPRIGIVGAGPAGISIAHKLGKADIPTVIFEAGGNDYSDESQDFYKGKVIGDPYFDLDVTRLRFLGGSSNHWAGWCRILEAHDFLPKPYVPHTGWPITRAAIEPFFPETFEILGIQPFTPDVPDIRRHAAVRADQERPRPFRRKIPAGTWPQSQHRRRAQHRGVGADGQWPQPSPAPGYGRTVRRPARSRSTISSSAPAGWRIRGCCCGPTSSRTAASCRMRPRSGATGWSTRCTRPAMPSSPTRMPSTWDGDGQAFLTPTPEAMAKRGILNFHIQIETNPYPGIKGYVADLACLMPEWTEWISEQLGQHLNCSSQIHVAWEQAPRPDNRIVLSKTDRDLPACRASSCTGPRTSSTTGPCSKACACSARPSPDRTSAGCASATGCSTAAPIRTAWNSPATITWAAPAWAPIPRPASSTPTARCTAWTISLSRGSSVFTTGGQCTPTTTITALALRLGDHLSRVVSS